MVRLREFQVIGVLALALGSGACAGRAAASSLTTPPPRAVDAGSICGGLADRFVALPALSADAASSARNAAPAAGRWWIRGCSASMHDGEVHAMLQGPGWYFVDEADGDLSLRQQVPFTLSVGLSGRLTGDIVDGVFSLWLLPDAEPKIELSVSKDLDVRASSAWGAVLRVMPLVPVRSMAADRFTQVARGALRSRLKEGATVTYDLGSGQEDATLGRLETGKVPERAFADSIRWLVNERLLLAPSVVHVFGPIAPGPTRLDVKVESGDGVAYRAVCTKDMADSYAALAKGHVADVPPQAIVARGSIAGAGAHTTDFSVPGCPFYLVVSAVGAAPTTLAALRVRA
jgi:hypothetical protein